MIERVLCKSSREPGYLARPVPIFTELECLFTLLPGLSLKRGHREEAGDHFDCVRALCARCASLDNHLARQELQFVGTFGTLP